MSMKIAFLVKHFVLSGGKERYVVELAKALSRQGHSIHVYGCECDKTLLNGITFHPVYPRSNSFLSVLNRLFFINETQKVVPKQEYDIVHSHERNYTQHVVTLHSLSYHEGLEKYYFLRRMDQKYLSVRSLLYLWLEKHQMKSPWLVSVSGAVSKDVEKYYGRSENIVSIPPGVNTKLFNPLAMQKLREQARRENGLNKNELAVLFVGSAFQRKGLDRLLPAIKGNMRLFVVGKGDKPLKFKRLIKAYSLENKVVFTGKINDVKPYYALADVVVLPSRSEAFGMSILEGMACGLPAIVSSNSGVADLIRHNDNGLLMKEDSDLVNYLNMLQSEKERSRLGIRARRTAESFSWDKIGIIHEAFYKQVLSNKKKNLS